MIKNPILSIVTPTRGNLSTFWLEQLLKVKGKCEFIFVFPPGCTLQEKTFNDKRIKVFESKHRGEPPQRLKGLLKAKGRYVLALDDDDFVHPDIVRFVENYWERFPEAWALRLRKKPIKPIAEESLFDEWEKMPDIQKAIIRRKGEPEMKEPRDVIYEIPIVPLNNPIDWKAILMPFVYKRTDHKGWHMENFVDRVWRNDLVQEAGKEYIKATHIVGDMYYTPPACSFGFDRVINLFLQAKFYEKDKIIGYWMTKDSEQIRKTIKDNRHKPARFHFFSHILLVKNFPSYGYLWNLFFDTLYGVPRMMAKKVRMAFCEKKK